MRAVLANAQFRRLWASAIGVSLGDAFMQMGLLELFRSHHYDERVETAKMLFALSLAGLLFGPFAMAYLDRWQRRNVLIVSDVLRALVVVIIAVWLLPLVTGRVEERHLFIVYVMIFLIGTITTFYYPARAALVPNLVPIDDLVTGKHIVCGQPRGGNGRRARVGRVCCRANGFGMGGAGQRVGVHRQRGYHLGVAR